jgi:hypothetical protein
VALVASACGGRTGLPVDDALANDAAAPEDTTPPSGAVPPALPCVSWKLVAGPTQISSASEDLDLTTMTAAPGGALLSWSVDIDPSDDSSDMGGLDDIGLASIPGGDVLLTWLDGDEGPGDVFAMSLSPEGVARGMPSLVWQAPLVLPESTVLASVRPDGQEAVVGVSAWLDPNASEQVVTLGIQCVH